MQIAYGRGRRKIWFSGMMAAASSILLIIVAWFWLYSYYIVYEPSERIAWGNPYIRREGVYLDMSEYILPWWPIITAFAIFPVCWVGERLRNATKKRRRT